MIFRPLVFSGLNASLWLQLAEHTIYPTVIRAFDRTTYGIFGGKPENTAVLRFSGAVAQWVSEEIWHPRQRSAWLSDGRYQLSLEIGPNPAELIQDILRYGANVEVVEPASLREAVRERLRAALAMYGAAE